MSRVILRAGRVQPVWAGHPWVFAQAVQRVDGAPAPGDVVEVLDPKGKHLGRGFWSPGSSIPVRIITRREDQSLDEACLAHRIEAAAAHRRELGLPGEATDGYRLIHAEGDGLPGLIVDVFGDVAVIQLLTIGMKRREGAIFGAVARTTGARTLVEVPGGRAQKREGIEVEPRVVRGPDVDAAALLGARHRVRDPDLADAEDGLLLRPARQPRARREAGPREAGARPLQLRGRVQHGGGPRRCARGAGLRQLGGRDRAGRVDRTRQRARRPSALRPRRRAARAREAPRGTRAFRSGHRRPAASSHPPCATSPARRRPTAA